MTLNKEDWQKLQMPLAILLVSIVLAWLLVSAASSRETQASEALQQQSALLEQARQQYRSSGTEKDNIEKYLPLYNNLIKRGFIGEEQRIDWISDLRNVNQANKFFGVNYEISAQEQYPPKFPVVTGPFKLRRSVMKLTFALLHENDLLTLFARLPSETNPPFMVRDCIVTKTNKELRGKFEPNLNAECEIDWLTIAEPNSKAAP